MSDIMTPIPFARLLDWILTEKKNQGTVFGQRRAYHAKREYIRTLFGRSLETPIGAAAGPHTQLAQNLVAAYYTGSRFFELKTVQIMDGRELAACIQKPCINAEEEGYNCEWSTELTVPQATEEYIKAWFLLKLLAKEFDLGDPDGFQFNISVGYDLEGIRSPKINTFLDTMKNAADSEVFCSCRQYLLDHIHLFEKVTAEDILAIEPEISNSVTLSTLHGCPAGEIERIARYLMTEKGFHTYIKCNPTLLGYEYVRSLMDDMGYRYLSFTDFHFKNDLQYEDAVPMLRRLLDTGKDLGLQFGVKLTNTFPVEAKQGELPSEEMYLSGKALYPLSMSVAAKLSGDFDGQLPISFSGGADCFNIKEIVSAGIWPVTVATTLLKPGGYQRMIQLALQTEFPADPDSCVDPDGVFRLAESSRTDCHHTKNKKRPGPKKNAAAVPLMDCFTAPCQEGCPIHQNIPAYMELVEQGRYEEALEVIMEQNPLPFITGTICFHKCMNRCTRQFYEEPVQIRDMKLLAASRGYEAVLKKITPPPVTKSGRAAVIGGGPAGMAAAWFLRKGGMETVIFEQSEALGGAVRTLIPDTRISRETIEKDASFLWALGVTARFNTTITSLEELKTQGYTAFILAPGAVRGKKSAASAGDDAFHSKVPSRFYEDLGICLNGQGLPVVHPDTLETCVPGVYIAGDGLKGPAAAVDAIRDGHLAADAVLKAAPCIIEASCQTCSSQACQPEEMSGALRPACQPEEMSDTSCRICGLHTRSAALDEKICERKGVLQDPVSDEKEAARCLNCSSVCENCADVCPNRANVVIRVPGISMPQIVHVDDMCNECGNCRTFCPYSGAPYLEKFTVFSSKEALADSKNPGFALLSTEPLTCCVRLQGEVFEWIIGKDTRLSEDLQRLIETICRDYSYLL